MGKKWNEMSVDEQMKRVWQHMKTSSINTDRRDVKGNPVRMLMTFDEFKDIWAPYWHNRGRRGDQFCMARNGDLGNYEVGNVRIVTTRENHKECGANYDIQFRVSAKMTKPRVLRDPQGRLHKVQYLQHFLRQHPTEKNFIRCALYYPERNSHGWSVVE